MLTQVAEKAPKWTFGGKRKEVLPGPAPGPAFVNPPDKYTREPAYTFPTGSPPPRRPISAPPGPKNVPLQPTTPKWSFGSVSRPDPFAPEAGPGPGLRAMPSSGPKYSFGGRPRAKTSHGGPGPNDYKPMRPESARVARWGMPPAGREPPPAGPGPGPGPRSGKPQGPAYSFRPRLDEKPVDDARPLGPQWTYFGYNDFGHSGCDNCKEPDHCIGAKPSGMTERRTRHSGANAKWISESPQSQSASLNRTTRGAKRPVSAPVGQGHRVPVSQGR